MKDAKSKPIDNPSSVKRRFTNEEKNFVHNNLNKLSPEDIAKHLGRSLKSIKRAITSFVENTAAVAENKEEEKENINVPAIFDPQSNAKAPEGIKAGDLMAGGEKQGRPGVVMMTSAASQALDEFKKNSKVTLTKPHENSIHRIR